MKWKNRTDGAETPYWSAGLFKIRLPFVHYRFEISDYMQGLLMCAVDLGAITFMADHLGMPFEVALAVVILNGLLYLTHHLLGDPVVPGWITPAIPLLILFVEQYPEGPDRMYALIAFQLLLGVFSIFLGVTGLARKVVRMVPNAIKAGVILGAGFAAIVSIFQAGGKFDLFPITISLGVGLAFYLLFSKHFEKLKKKNKIWGFIYNLGILPAIVISVLLAPVFGEAPWPKIEWGFSNPDFLTLWSDYTIFGLGFPALSFFLSAIPVVFATYLVVFGDVIQAKALLNEADNIRQDESIDFNENRSHVIFGGRNVVMSILGPDIAMCGPMWAAMQVVIVERFKGGKKAMHSIFGGAGSFRWGTNTGLLLMPIVTFVQPILAVAMALTILVQGYVSVRIGIMQARSQRDLGIAGIIGGILVIKGAGMALMAGILLCFLIYGKNFFKGENDQTFNNEEILTKEGEAI